MWRWQEASASHVGLLPLSRLSDPKERKHIKNKSYSVLYNLALEVTSIHPSILEVHNKPWYHVACECQEVWTHWEPYSGLISTSLYSTATHWTQMWILLRLPSLILFFLSDSKFKIRLFLIVLIILLVKAQKHSYKNHFLL